MRQLVLHGLPTTRMRTSLAALSLIALPCGPKMPPLTDSRSPRSIPALRGTDPTSSAHDTPSNASSALDVRTMSCSSGNAQSSSSMATPSSDFIAGSISSMCSTIGWSGPSSWPDAMRKTIAYPICPAAPVTATWTGRSAIDSHPIHSNYRNPSPSGSKTSSSARRRAKHRNPVCATMRCDGRMLRPRTVQPRCRTS